MSDTESFEHAMADMRKVVMDCDMERCDMYDGDCYQCQGDILDRMQKAHERELEHVRKAEYARGYHDGQHSMDAEHYAVALRLMHLPLDGGSHENLSQIARAVYHSDFGWTQGACRALRDELVRLMGGVHKPDAALPTYDVLGNERHKVVCRLREIQTDAGGFVKALANALGVEWQAPRVHQTLAEVRDRLINLLDGGTEPNSQISPILVNSDGEDGGEVTITDELRKFKGHINAGLTPEMVLALRAQINWISDRIEEQLKTIRQNEYDEWQLHTDKMRAMLTEQRDEARAKVLKLESENAEWKRGAERDADKLESLTGAYNDAVAEREELQRECDRLTDALDELQADPLGDVLVRVENERDELQAKLNAIREAVDAV